MKVFICWSGRRSKQLAEALHQWLPSVLNGLAPTYSPDISKGALWFDSINRELNRSQAGIVCLTPENMDMAWIHFEAGALFRETTKIFTLLYKVPARSLRGPLSNFQGTEATRGDLWKLVEALATLMAKEAPDPQERLKTFEEQWPLLETHLNKIRALTVQELIPNLEGLFKRKTYNEPLAECKDQRWRARYDGARETLIELTRSMDKVREYTAPHMAEYYEELIQAVDGYCMEMGACLLKEQRFGKRKDGKLKIADAMLGTCERRRRKILGLLNDLIDERGAPILDASRLFRKLVTIEDKKTKCIHPLEKRIKGGEVPEGIVPDGLVSQWDFDRIAYYLVQENRKDFDMQRVSESVTIELEKVRAREEEGSLVPLHYAIRALERGVRRLRRDHVLSAKTKSEVQRVIERVAQYLRGNPSRDAGSHIKENLVALRAALK
ncbi:MAG: hypothetical protein ND866_28615 [Pyrinomonadaceae bacterium]|nr:hypothetical protein [Pyrinomonadaceae bacterium]